MAKQPKEWQTMSPIDFFKAHIAELVPRGNALHLGQCPNCQRKAFRVFDTSPIEWRCPKCNLSGWGVKEFVEIIGEHRLPALKSLVREAENRKALEAEGIIPDETPARPKEMEANQEVEERRQERMKESAGYRDPLLSNGHPRRMAGVVWTWLHLNDQVKSSYKDHKGREWGIVKSFPLQQFIAESALILDQSERNIRNHLNRLKRWDYIRISRDTEEIHIIKFENI